MRVVQCTHSLIVDNLKVYQVIHKSLKDFDEMIVQASNDTGACYRVAICAEIIFERRKMNKDEDLQILNEQLKTIDTEKNEIDQFLRVEKDDRIKKEEMHNRGKEEISR